MSANSMSQTPLVSVIIPCYRQAQFMATAVDSTLAQTYPAVEVLVVNDGSDDDTEAVARRYGERVRYIYRDNGGLPAARNTGIAQARGAYLKFLDADDHLHPEQIAWQMAALGGRDDCLSLTGVRLYREDNPGQHEDHVPLASDLMRFMLSLDDTWLPPNAYLVPIGMVRAVNGFDESLRYFEDWEFFSRVALREPGVLVDPRVGAYYRLRCGSMSAQREGMTVTRAGLLIKLHDTLRSMERREWFGIDLLKAEQGAYQSLIALGAGTSELRTALLSRIKELQAREGFGSYGWRFQLLARLMGYARAERIRCGVIRWLGKKAPETLDTGAWREVRSS
ncbi:MAG: glycosyltransferase family 2 protein [Planctomycetes bacterium]|nr:glycosyltransferase family 2 protein [Planctomycetota bacterium]